MDERQNYGQSDKKRERGPFNFIELAICIVVIGALLAILIPTFNKVLENSRQKAAVTEARAAWVEIALENEDAYAYLATVDGEVYGWFYDHEEGIAKYHVNGAYTVTFDGENYSAIPYVEPEGKGDGE